MFWLIGFTLLAIFCWPLALVLLVLLPFLWLLSIPFRIVGFALKGLLALVSEIFLLPARLLASIGPR